MTLDDLRAIARRLPLNAPDMKGDVNALGAALTSHTGRLPAALDALQQSRADTAMQEQVAQHCGGAILVLLCVIEHFDLSLEEAIRLGNRELQ